MSFKSIGGVVSKKLKNLEEKERSEIQLTNQFNEFLKQTYKEELVSRLRFSLRYIPAKKCLIIYTNSKIFANDLILKLDLMTKFFHRKTKDINQIVIK